MDQNQIIDGSGNGYLAGVNTDNKLITKSTIVPAIHEATLLGDAYSWTAVNANIDAGDTALCVVNQSNTRWLVISHAYVRVDVETQVKFHVPAVAVWDGTTVLGVNLNRNFAHTAPAVAYADETVNAFVAANVIETVYCANAVNSQVTTSLGVKVDFNDALILGYDDALAVDVITEPGAFECTIVGYFIDSPA